MSRLLDADTRSIERFVGARRGAPIRLFECTATTLPDPAQYRGAIISLTDLDTLAYSNGTRWYPVQLGAAL